MLSKIPALIIATLLLTGSAAIPTFAQDQRPGPQAEYENNYVKKDEMGKHHKIKDGSQKKKRIRDTAQPGVPFPYGPNDPYPNGQDLYHG